MGSPQIKCVVVGDGTVGKTCLLKTFVEDSFPDGYVPTVFDNYTTSLVVDGRKVDIQLWDTSGQTDYDRLRHLAYPRTDIFLVCFSVNSFDSLSSVKDRWGPELKHYSPRVPIVLVGTKLDLRDDKEKSKDLITTNQALATMRELGAKRYIECSAKTLKGVGAVFEEAVKLVLHPEPEPSHHRRCSIL